MQMREKLIDIIRDCLQFIESSDVIVTISWIESSVKNRITEIQAASIHLCKIYWGPDELAEFFKPNFLNEISIQISLKCVLACVPVCFNKVSLGWDNGLVSNRRLWHISPTHICVIPSGLCESSKQCIYKVVQKKPALFFSEITWNIVRLFGPSVHICCIFLCWSQ